MSQDNPILDFQESAELSASAHEWLRQGYLLGAESRFRKILEKYPKSPQAPDAMLQLARVKYRKGAPREKIKAAYETVAANYPDSSEAAEALYSAARIQLRGSENFQGTAELDESIALFEKATSHPKASRELIVRGMTRLGATLIMRYYKVFREEDLRKALEIFEECLKEFTDFPDEIYRCLMRIGRAHLLLREFDAAEKAYQAACEYNWNASIYQRLMPIYSLGILGIRKEDYPFAIRYFRQFLGSIPGDDMLDKDNCWRSFYLPDESLTGIDAIHRTYLNYAWALHNTGCSQEARETLLHLLHDFRDDKQVCEKAREYLAEIRKATGEEQRVDG